MELRINHQKANPGAYAAMQELEKFVAGSGLDKRLYELVKIRASQINGCAFCLDMHAKALLRMGEPPERIVLLQAWREAPAFDARERAALELTEAVTRIADGGVPDDVYARVREQFDEREFVALLMAAVTINGWNRIAIATGMYPGCFA